MGDFAGYSVDYLGDVDGDGLDDLIIGAIGEDELGENSGASYIVLGASLGLEDTLDLSNADYKLMGEDADEYSGTSVSGAGDVDGDGLDDIVIGAPQDNDVVSSGGAAYVVLGASLGQAYEIDLADADYKLEGAVGSEYAGTAVQGLGDVDGDGLDDIWIGAPGGLYDKVAGKAYLVFGSSLSLVGTMSLDDADAIWTGETPTNNQYGTSFGYSAVPAGDLDGDGLGDVLVGARADNDGGQYAGAVYIGLTGE